jgi:hypothetical protein
MQFLIVILIILVVVTTICICNSVSLPASSSMDHACELLLVLFDSARQVINAYMPAAPLYMVTQAEATKILSLSR